MQIATQDDCHASQKRRVQPKSKFYLRGFVIGQNQCLSLYQRFAAVIMRIRDPKTTALIFASGKMVITGAKSEELAKLAARKYARIVQKIGFEAKFSDFKIQNIVGSCDVKFPIRLESLAHRHGHFCSVCFFFPFSFSLLSCVGERQGWTHVLLQKKYEPELFPGLIYRMINPKVVLLIFVSGKIVLTGAKEREQIYEAFENMYPVLGEFKKITLTG